MRFLLAALARWLNHQQAEAMAYVIEENRTLRVQMGGRRLRLMDDLRRGWRSAKRLGRARLCQVAAIVTPDTIPRWHRQLIARKVDPIAGIILVQP